MSREDDKTLRDAAADLFGWSASLVCPGIVVSSRVRVARNLVKTPFPDRLTPEGRRTVRDHVFARVQALDDPRWTLVPLDDVSADDKLFLVESHLITPELAQRDAGAGLMIYRPVPPKKRPVRGRHVRLPDPGETAVAVMVNEEDHLRIQCTQHGSELGAAYRAVYEVESALDGNVFEYAFDQSFGYLTSCPTNMGTGLRVGMMLHLVGLYLAGDLEKTLHALDRLGLEARGIHGEGSADAPGCLYQISNAQTLGESEEQILRRVSQLLQDVAMQEDWARVRLFETRPKLLDDYVCRSVGIGCEARLLTYDEAIGLYYAGLFGLEMGLLGYDGKKNPYEDPRPFVLPESVRRLEGYKTMGDDDLCAARALSVRRVFENFRTPGP